MASWVCLSWGPQHAMWDSLPSCSHAPSTQREIKQLSVIFPLPASHQTKRGHKMTTVQEYRIRLSRLLKRRPYAPSFSPFQTLKGTPDGVGLRNCGLLVHLDLWTQRARPKRNKGRWCPLGLSAHTCTRAAIPGHFQNPGPQTQQLQGSLHLHPFSILGQLPWR